MINEESIRAVRTSRLNSHFGKPLYDGYGFAALPGTIQTMLTGHLSPHRLPSPALGLFPPHYEKVIVLFIDAFGWRFVERFYKKYPFLQRIAQEGVISVLSTQFPSTTSAHVTTFHTGKPVGETGIYEWFIYEPTLDAMIIPLMYSYAGDEIPETLRKSPANPKTIYPRQNVYSDLAARGVKSYLFQPHNIIHSTYTETLSQGASLIGYRTLSEGLVNLAELALRVKGKALFYWYYDAIDSICHRYGPDSPHVAAEIDTCMNALERLFHAAVAGKLKNTAVMLIADHGQTEVNPETTVYLNQALPALVPLIRQGQRGDLLTPAGSSRDMFLHVLPNAVDEAQTMLTRRLEGYAEVYRTNTLIEQGFFGETISDSFRARIADLVVLPYQGNTVWWYEKGIYEMRFLGMHGGLGAEEMETNLLFYPYI